MKKKCDEVILGYRNIHKSGINFNIFDCQKADGNELFGSIKDDFCQTSMFKEKKLFLILNPFSNTVFKDIFLGKVDLFSKSDNLILIMQEGEIRKNDCLFSYLKENSKSQEFSLLTGIKFLNWTKKEFENNNTQIDDSALGLFCDRTGGDLWLAANEIKKISAFKNCSRVCVEDINSFIKQNLEVGIFETIDAISSKNKERALLSIRSHIEKGDSPLYILSMIAFQFKNILVIRDLIDKNKSYDFILRASGLHPFVVKKSFFQARSFSLRGLKKIYQDIFKADFDIKTGKIDPESALDFLISEICTIH